MTATASAKPPRRRLPLLPDSITGWFLLVLAAVLICSHLAVLAVYARDRHQALEAAGLRQAAARMAAAVETVGAAPAEARAPIVRAMGGPGFHLGLTDTPLAEPRRGGALARVLAQLLAERLPGGTDIVVGRLNRDALPERGPGHDRGMGPGARHHMMMTPSRPGQDLTHLAASVRLPDGAWLTGLALLERPERLWRPAFLGWVTGLVLVVAAVAWWGVRRAVRPLRVLEAHAARLGVDVAHAEPLPESGPREVRGAATAFNEMQRRLTRYVEDRTRMLAAISHDLRTPITRLRLRAELMDDDGSGDRAKMLRDLEDMERMIAATLSFARQDAAAEPVEPLDLAGLLRDAAEGRAATAVEAPGTLEILGRSTGLRRVFANLMDNAEAYGHACRVTLRTADGAAVVTVDDDGPGIPTAEREKVFAPFYRLEGSRSRETGGTGLGLSVARTIVHAHGGTITLGDGQGGTGLRVTVTLPRG
ncbi:ATP-binding protein [Caenispirillum salinarum]|uniref:ATP-binding protein n=1 Tax=Caenispirillum salinarum TaxID=859058 RepID=UPI00384EB8D1